MVMQYKPNLTTHSEIFTIIIPLNRSFVGFLSLVLKAMLRSYSFDKPFVPGTYRHQFIQLLASFQ